MTEYAIEVNNISKVYNLYRHPIDRLKEALHPRKKAFHEKFVALEGIDFQIKKGQTVGILGKNGSGKSTILKILAGIVSPTSGSYSVRGKLVALLELGAGFNPELSGYDNILLSGVLSGIPENEMRTRVSEIVKFSEIGSFVDQPVKTYSSGMFARLAFSVAININPDILIVDEALRVGDISFQIKCVQKIREMLRYGMTFLFVSHDVGALKNMCDEAIWLDEGRLVAFGEMSLLADKYVQSFLGDAHAILPKFENKLSSSIKISQVDSKDMSGQRQRTFNLFEKIRISISLVVSEDLENIIVAFYVKNRFAVEVLGTNSLYEGKEISKLQAGENIHLDFVFENYLRSGDYSITALVTDSLHSNTYLDWIDGACSFTVLEDLERPRWCMVSVPFSVEITR